MDYNDGGCNVRLAPLMKIEKKYDDVPLGGYQSGF